MSVTNDTLYFIFQRKKLCLKSGMFNLLVNTLTSCKVVDMYGVHIKPLSSYFFFYKCLSTSMCLIMSFCTELWTNINCQFVVAIKSHVPIPFDFRIFCIIFNHSIPHTP